MRPFPRALRAGRHAAGGKVPFEVDIQHLIPFGHTHSEEFRGRKNAGVAAQDVDAAVPFNRSLRHADIVFHPGNVGRYGTRHFPNFGSGCFGLGKVPCGKEHASTLAGKYASYALPYSLACPGHDDRASFDRSQHGGIHSLTSMHLPVPAGAALALYRQFILILSARSPNPLPGDSSHFSNQTPPEKHLALG